MWICRLVIPDVPKSFRFKFAKLEFWLFRQKKIVKLKSVLLSKNEKKSSRCFRPKHVGTLCSIKFSLSSCFALFVWFTNLLLSFCVALFESRREGRKKNLTGEPLVSSTKLTTKNLLSFFLQVKRKCSYAKPVASPTTLSAWIPRNCHKRRKPNSIGFVVNAFNVKSAVATKASGSVVPYALMHFTPFVYYQVSKKW